MASGKPPAPRKAKSVVQQWEDYRNYNRHCDKVEQVKSSIDNSWSLRQDDKLAPSRYNAKKEQMTADRYGEIERENRRLLLKMMEIDRTGGKAKSDRPQRAPSRGHSRSGSQPPPADRRVNPARLRELERIDAENLKLLKRIQKAKPSVSATKLDTQHSQQQKVMRMRCQNRPESQPAADRSESRGSRRMHEADTWDEEFRKLCALEERLRCNAEEDHVEAAPEGDDELTVNELVQKHAKDLSIVA